MHARAHSCRSGLTWGVGMGVVPWFLLGASLLLARAAEPTAYTAIQQSVEAKTHAQTIHDARAFLRRFPQSAEQARVRFWLAEALYASRAYPDAALVYRELLRQTPAFPQAPVAWRHLGLSEFYARDYNAALATFTQLLQLHPGVAESAPIVFHLADVYFKQGRFGEALPLYQQLQEDPTLPVSTASLHLQLAHCYFHLQKFDRAQHHYGVVLQKFPSSPEAPLAHYQLGAIALAQKEFEVARQHFQTMIQTYAPGATTVLAHYGMAWTLVYQHQLKAAVAYLKQRNLLAQPSATDAVLARSYDLVRLRAYHKAIPLLTQALTHAYEAEQEQPLRWLLAQAYEGVGENARALQVLDDFVHRFPHAAHLAAVQTWRGNLLRQRRDTAPELTAYRAALAAAQEDETAERLLLRIAELHQTHHAVEDAIETWQRLVQNYPLSPRRFEVQLRMGSAWVQQGAIAQAVSLYRRLLTADVPPPVRVRTELQLAWAYLKGGEHDQALDVYAELVNTAQEPEILHQAHFWRGWILQQQERYEAANAEWLALLSLQPAGPNRGEVLWRLGKNLMELGQCKEARDHLQEVLTTYATDPYAPLAAWPLQRCLLALGQDQEALQWAAAFSRQEPLAYFHVAERFTHAKRLFDNKQYRQARQAFQRILAQPFVSPLADDAAFLIAESFWAEGDRRRALASYRMVSQQYAQTNVTALAAYREGLILQEAENLPATVQALRRAVQQATETDIRDRAWYHLGKAYMQLHQPADAVAVFRRLLQEETPTFAGEAERLHLGLLLQQLADYPMALQVFRNIVHQSAVPRLRAEAQFWTAETYHLRGETQASLAAYQQVAQQFPDQLQWALTALFRAGKIYEDLHQYQDAIKMYQRIVNAQPNDPQGQFAAERVKYLKAKMAETAAQKG